MPRAHVEVKSFTYEANSCSRPRRRCPGCGERGGIVETTASTNGGPQVATLACSACGWSGQDTRRR